jgi:HD-GYP domain-containing protein (c-di-GMP phosphodiesterase class II)
VAILNLLIGMKMFHGHPKKVQELALCGFWHDIGKVQVRKEIIYKRGKFSPEEREEAERHVFYSEQIMRGHDMTEEVCQSGRSHHERWDGRGYPDGVSGKMIPLYARITAVSDSYDAITSNKVYRRGSNEWHGLAEIARNMGAFDPRIFFVLLEIVLRNEDLITGFKTRFGLDAYEIGLRSEISVGDANPFHLPIGS